jgi:hypothetical protein
MENGFKFSLQLKNCSNKRGLHPDLAIQMKKKTTMNQNTAGAIFTSFA